MMPYPQYVVTEKTIKVVLKFTLFINKNSMPTRIKYNWCFCDI